MPKAKVRKKVKTTASEYEKRRMGEKPLMKLGRRPKLLHVDKPIAMLVDAEILLYHVVSSHLEEYYHRDRDVYTWEINRKNARAEFRERVLGLAQWMHAKQIVCAWGGMSCFRRSILGSYKQKRYKTKKPLGYWALADWTREQGDWLSIQWDRLEADDVLGVFATDPRFLKDYHPVIVSDDKDLKTIPGLHLRFRSADPDEQGASQGIFNVTQEEADRNHLVQALTGDPGDGYFGIAGVGPTKAEQIILATGPNADARKVLPPLSVWERIVWAYENAELTEQDALTNARCARILRRCDFNPRTGEVTLWTPSQALQRRPKKKKKKST